MGTRGLTAVYVDGNYKIAQYGQWDHYPGGQGVVALAFLREMDEAHFREALSRCKFVSAGEANALFNGPKGRYFTRDHGAKILDLVDKSQGEVLLYNQINFAGDSLLCEYAYVVDLDKRTFEVYKGSNRSPLDPSERFADAPPDKTSPPEYGPVRLWRTFVLDKLPTEAEFLDDLGGS